MHEIVEVRYLLFCSLYSSSLCLQLLQPGQSTLKSFEALQGVLSDVPVTFTYLQKILGGLPVFPTELDRFVQTVEPVEGYQEIGTL